MEVIDLETTNFKKTFRNKWGGGVPMKFPPIRPLKVGMSPLTPHVSVKLICAITMSGNKNFPILFFVSSARVKTNAKKDFVQKGRVEMTSALSDAILFTAN